jgi:photosystem II stability/assembly factor-like uncharacterized protein
MESDGELASVSSTSRSRRALTLIALSVVTITAAGIAYLHPSVAPRSALPAVDQASSSAQLVAVDFVTPQIGWAVLDLPPRNFAVLHTTDAGATWTRQLAGVAGALGEYVRFFDPAHGVIVPLGPQSALYQTTDGGGTWRRHPVTKGDRQVWSADFVDPEHGWLLAQASVDAGSLREALLRTEDGGGTWADLGNPVLPGDWAYRVEFAGLSDGWVYSKSAGPYAYKSENGGTTWRRVALPPPPGGWPAAPAPSFLTETFFVAARPTDGAGVMTTVIGVAPLEGLTPEGGVSLDYPPLKVGAFDGGRSITYVYADVSPYRYASIEYVNPGQFVATEPQNQYQLSSVDGGRSWNAIVPPSTYGAVGYVDALHWWWIGSGAGATSHDAGRTWTQPRGLGVPEPLPGSLHFIDATHAWYGATSGMRPLVETTDDGGAHWRTVLLPDLASA